MSRRLVSLAFVSFALGIYAVVPERTAALAASAQAGSKPASQAAKSAPPAPQPAANTVKPPATDAAMIASAMSAAPAAVSKDATIVNMDEKHQLRTLRQGTNGWTCMPDGPSPGVDPMCLDKNGMEWAAAWMAHKDPPKGKMGFGYMLMGGSDASNTDPFAEKPNTGDRWVDTGPHVMILNIGTQFDGYPTTPKNPKAPYVMYPNTPYAHLMLPVK
jgi:hypothetical protein